MTISGCKPDAPPITAPTEAYRAALAATAPGSPADGAALARVTGLFADFTTSNVTARVREVYAADAYLRDGFKELHGIDAIAPYMIRSAESQRHCTFEFEDVISHGGDYYLRWVMASNLKRDDETRIARVIGLTHMRFNPAGQIIFQQDYWDPSDVLYSRIPVAGWLIKKVKSSL